ncbi:MAG: rlmCD [Rickettsiales bacterium]|jgi:23S rRNA (uracil1939-C5)-methyltransferase|nr:rlmCD [Rickettsiales bacterium]
MVQRPNRKGSAKPLTPIQEISLEINELGGLGDGIGLYEGRRVYVPGGLPGDLLTVGLYSVTKDSAKGNIIEIQKPSPDRVHPFCLHYTECGGCSLQHLSESLYYQFKEDRLKRAVRDAGFSEDLVESCVKIGKFSRRRAVFKVKREKNNVILGYFKENSHLLFNLSACDVLSPEILNLTLALKKDIQSNRYLADIEELCVSILDSGMDVIIQGRNVPELIDIEGLVAFSKGKNIARIVWKTEKEIIPIFQLGVTAARMGEIAVPLPVGTFLQATKTGETVMAEAILEMAKQLPQATQIIDLYAGCGTYSFPLASALPYARIHAVEGSEAMVGAIKQASRANGLEGRVTAESRDLFKKPFTHQELKRFDMAVINPPRNGAETQTRALAESNIKKIVMVSCNPATFSRDAKILKEKGFSLMRALPIDQFYGSAHLELVAVFVR